MTDNTDLFNPDTGDHGTDPSNDETTDHFSELVGEGKKFKDVQSLARGKAESDRFISKLQSELEELRTELKGRMRLEEVLNKLSTPPSNSAAPQQDEEEEEPSSQTKPQDISKLIEQKLQEERKKLEFAENVKKVKTKLMEVYGSSYPSRLKEIARELEVSEDSLTRLAGENPKMFFRTTGIDTTSTKKDDVFTPPPQGRTTGSSFNTGERTKAFYDKLKKENPSEYWTPKIQSQMHKDAIRLGEKFFT